MTSKFLTALFFVLMAFFGSSTSTCAQWVTQTIKLVPGFNPVFLQVTPQDPSCAAVFASTPEIREVWLYNRYLQTATFATNSAQSNLGQDHWLTWFAPGGPKSFLTTLAQVRGGQSYLIHLATNSNPVTLLIKGVPAPPRSDWIPNDVVLAGFPIMETGKVTFYQFLKDSPQVAANPGQDSAVFSINPATAFESQIRNPEVTKILPGRAYWAMLQGHTHNPYPFEVLASGANNSVQFLQDSPVSSITLSSSVATGSQTLHLQILESEEPPSGNPPKAGTVPMAALIPVADGSFALRNLANGVDLELAAGEKKQLRLGMILRSLSPAADTNSTYQAFLEVTEKVHGYRQLIPVVGEVPGSKLFSRSGNLLSSRGRIKALADNTSTVSTAALNAGLWVGTLTLNAVNQPGFSQTNNPDPSQFPVSAATPLTTRVLIHVDSNGVSRLAQQVFFADVPNGSNMVTRMYSNLTNMPAGATIKSRVSAPSWPTTSPTLMTGSFGSNVTTAITVPFDDRVNPFVHKYHPDHNNLAEDFTTALPAGQESFNITRNVAFYFGVTTQTGTSSYAPTVPALKFTGTSGQFINTSSFSTTPALTVQCWVNIASILQNGAPLVLLTNANTHTQFKLAFQANTGQLGLTIANSSGSSSNIVTTNSIPIGTWVSVIATYDGTSSATLYVNGVSAATAYMPALASGAWDSAWVGSSPGSGTTIFNGQIHDVVVRNGAVSLQTVPQVMVVPQLLNASSILLDLQGNAVSTSVSNLGTSAVTVNLSSSQLVDLSSAPSVPLWTYGTAQGTYMETIAGLRRQAITIQGSFQFTRVSQDYNLY